MHQYQSTTASGAEEGRELLSWWTTLTGSCIAAWLVSALTYYFSWLYITRPAGFLPDPPLAAQQLWWLVCALACYGGLAWPRMGGWFVAAHLSVLAVLTTTYLDHIAQLKLQDRGLNWSPLPPVLAGLAMLVVIAPPWAWWYRGIARKVRFSLRSLVAATVITAVALAGLSLLEARGRQALERSGRPATMSSLPEGALQP